MPRGQKSKRRAREKRRQARVETKDLGDAQAAASPTPASGSTPPGSPTASAGPEPQGAAASSSPVAGASCPRSKGRSRRRVKERTNSSQASSSPDPLTKKAGVLIHFMLEKFKMKQPIRKIDMLKLFHTRYKTRFPEILRRAAECMELAFGLDLKEVKPNGYSYTLVSKLGLINDGVPSSRWGLPKNGLLMPLLSVICLNGNRASEADVWEFLNILGIYDGKEHVIFGDPRKLITEEFVQQNYLVYRQVPNSDPPSYEFLWGPRAYAETNKMKVLEFLAKINDTIPSALLPHYEAAWRKEAESTGARAAARAGTSASGSDSPFVATPCPAVIAGRPHVGPYAAPFHFRVKGEELDRESWCLFGGDSVSRTCPEPRLGHRMGATLSGSPEPSRGRPHVELADRGAPCRLLEVVPQSPDLWPRLLPAVPSTAVMPHGQKSKHRAREKRRQARAETQGLHDQATASVGEETTSSSPPDSESAPSSSSAAGSPKGPRGAQGTTSAAPGAVRKRSGVSGAARSRSGVGGEGRVQEGENSSQASAAAESSHTDPLNEKTQILVKFLLYKYKIRELIKRSEMLKVINRKCRKQFPEILRRASEHVEMVFGLVLKEVRPNSHLYTLVSNLDLSDSESLRGDLGLPKNGLLMPLLCVIYLNGHRASEERIWMFLNILGIYDGRSHFIFGDIRKLITEDLVREEYLEYRPVPGSDPPRYEFLWGPKALTDTSKMKVLEFLAKVNDTVPAAFLPHYGESFRQEVESTGARAAARIGTSASGMAGTFAWATAGTSAWASAGTSASVWDGPSAAAQAEYPASARAGLSAAASAGPSASASAHARATSSRSSRP
ncbi:uncharacterized protein LOC129563827 [Moschus berezovskii]|uniref:uncharacterized protein LOC129563827 n=1 Tax=Moschus berezovskii TaxID=68408 RepID=UPI00244506AE|nr:uncharacterized protein LOC129563827 [Moschus berezovskii]